MYKKRNNELEILALYTKNYRNELYLREISRRTRLPLKTTQNTLFLLEKDNILRSRTSGKNKYFYLQPENPKTKLFLLQAEIFKTISFLEQYPLLKTFLKSLSSNVPLLVFGSFANGAANNNSDLDIFLISEPEKELPFHLIPYKIHKIELSKKNFLHVLGKGETLIKEIEENHILINNHSFFVHAFWKAAYG